MDPDQEAEFDAAATGTHPAFVDGLVERIGDLDLVILAFGVLGDQQEFDADPSAAVEAVHVNYTGGVSISLAVAERFRAQGHGDHAGARAAARRSGGAAARFSLQNKFDSV